MPREPGIPDAPMGRAYPGMESCVPGPSTRMDSGTMSAICRLMTHDDCYDGRDRGYRGAKDVRIARDPASIGHVQLVAGPERSIRQLRFSTQVSRNCLTVTNQLHLLVVAVRRDAASQSDGVTHRHGTAHMVEVRRLHRAGDLNATEQRDLDGRVHQILRISAGDHG